MLLCDPSDSIILRRQVFGRGIAAKLVIAKSLDYCEAAMAADSEFCGNTHIGGGDTGPTFHVLLLWTRLARHPQRRNGI